MSWKRNCLYTIFHECEKKSRMLSLSVLECYIYGAILYFLVKRKVYIPRKHILFKVELEMLYCFDIKRNLREMKR